MENVKKLKFNSEDFEKYGTKRLNIQNGFLKLKKGDFIIIKTEKTKYGYQKAVSQLDQPDLRDLMKDWEVQKNDYLKDEGIEPITIYTVIRFIIYVIQVALKLGMCGLMIKINLVHSYGWSKVTRNFLV